MRENEEGGERMNKLDCLYIGARVRLEKAGERIRDFFASQDGVNTVVATIVMLLITVILIAVFWEQLSGWVKQILEIIFNHPLPSETDFQ